MVDAAEPDPLCYPDTTVLKNLPGIKDQATLDSFELINFLTRFHELFPSGNLDYPHYLSLHRHLFQDVYAWAGEPRSVRIGDGAAWFCYPDFIDTTMRRIFTELGDAKHYTGVTTEAFATGVAHVIADINAVHPFREGNGRTQIALLTMLADNAGVTLEKAKLDHGRLTRAIRDSFAGDEAALAAVVRDIVA